MFCKNCGKEIDDNAVVCPSCGVATDKLKDEVTETPSATVVNAEKKINIFAITGFVLSLVSLVFSILYLFVIVLGIIFSVVGIVGLVLSIIGIRQKNKYDSYNILAMVGFILGAISVLIFLIVLIILLVALF